MVSTRRSRSVTAGGDGNSTDAPNEPLHASQPEVSSASKQKKLVDAADSTPEPKQLQPIAEEPAAAQDSGQPLATPQPHPKSQRKQTTVNRQRRHSQRSQQQQQVPELSPAPAPVDATTVAPEAEAGAVAAAAEAETPQAVQQQPSAEQQKSVPQEEDRQQQQSSDGFGDADDVDDSWDFDGPDMLQNLAAAMRSALGTNAAQQPKQRSTPHATAADEDALDVDNLRWRPETGLQLPPRAGRLVASTAAATANQQQQELFTAGPVVHNPVAGAEAAAVAPPGEGALAAGATKPKGLAKQLPVAEATNGKKKKQEPKTAGKKWYDLPAVEITDEVKRDLRLLRLRGAYDPKRFYKSFDETKFPKHFAIGTVVDDPLDFYGGRLTQGQRKATLTEQLLADQELNTNRKKRYNKLQDEAQKWVKHKKRKTSQPRKQPAKHRPKH